MYIKDNINIKIRRKQECNYEDIRKEIKQYKNDITKLIDEFIINSLMVEHLQNKNDLTYISYIWNNSVIIPNIFIINSELFITLFENRYSNKEINIHNIIYYITCVREFQEVIKYFLLHLVLELGYKIDKPSQFVFF